MSKISKFIFIPILALLLCFSILFVGCSNKNNSSNNNSSNNSNNNVTPPQNIDYFQELGKYIEQNGKYNNELKLHIYQFDSSNNATEDKNFYGVLDYKPNKYFTIKGYHKSKNSVIQFAIPNQKDYSGQKYSVNGRITNLLYFDLSFTAENATVPFDSCLTAPESQDPTKFQECVQIVQDTIKITMQSFSSYFSKKVLNSSDKMKYANVFHFPTTVTITNKTPK